MTSLGGLNTIPSRVAIFASASLTSWSTLIAGMGASPGCKTILPFIITTAGIVNGLTCTSLGAAQRGLRSYRIQPSVAGIRAVKDDLR